MSRQAGKYPSRGRRWTWPKPKSVCPDSDHVLVTTSQIFKGGLGPEHVLEVDAKGKPVEQEQDAPFGRRIRPSVETGMHQAIYAARPDVGAVVHTHAPPATVWGLSAWPAETRP